jgi:hypothetical protein
MGCRLIPLNIMTSLLLYSCFAYSNSTDCGNNSVVCFFYRSFGYVSGFLYHKSRKLIEIVTAVLIRNYIVEEQFFNNNI